MSLFPQSLFRQPVFLGLICIAAACELLAQEPSEEQRQKDIRASVKDIELIIDRVRPALFGGLTGSDARIYKQITFRVSAKEALSRAGSSLEDGSRIVEIDEGYGRQIEMMAEAMFIEQAQDRPVMIPYVRYVVLSWRQDATFIKSPSEFAHFDFDRALDSSHAAEAFSKSVTGAIAFVLAHEVGHHVLGHYDKPLPTDPEKLRQMELDADSWAIRCLEKANPHFSPLSGLLPLIFDYYITPKPIEHETHSDHPADLRRIHSMFEAMDAAAPDYRADIEKAGATLGFTYSDFRRSIKASLLDYEQQIRTDSPPIQELPGTTQQ